MIKILVILFLLTSCQKRLFYKKPNITFNELTCKTELPIIEDIEVLNLEDILKKIQLLTLEKNTIKEQKTLERECLVNIIQSLANVQNPT